jgi:hypothetical protein
MKLDNVRGKVWVSAGYFTWYSLKNSVWNSVEDSVFRYLQKHCQFKNQLPQRIKNELE